MAFGEVGIKERVKTIMSYKKPTFWLLIIAVITCISVTICFLTNPKTINNEEIVITMLETHRSGNLKSYAKITAKDSKGKVLWTYETTEYYPTDSVGVDIIKETNNQYIFNECGSIVSLDKKTGSVNWKNEDFGGRFSHITVDETSNFYYLTGHYGPDLFIMDSNGKTVHKIQQFDPQYSNAGAVQLEANFAKVLMFSGPTNEVPFSFRVNLTDYSYELVDNPPDENTHSSTYVSDEEHLLNNVKAYTTITARNDSGDALWTYDTEEYEKGESCRLSVSNSRLP